ncbi:MAG: DnaB-like helicase C-terminal domain-containing protein, partial [Bacteroidales bacterium]|nr:DnaB-like helicase C-terminal domain-containing protein [Bacteroidales bacterium]
RPSMGKTAFVLSMARNMAVEYEVPVAFFSLEMSNIQLVNRLIIAESGIPSEKIRNGKLSNDEWTQLTVKTKQLADAKIFIDDTPALSIFELRAKCRRLKAQHNIGIVIIDYLQLMTGPTDTKGNREQEVSTISRSLKAIAKELDIPIIALSQLNRSVETRGGNKRPQLSDLRESGAIEQDADVVIFIHRPEYYGFDVDDDGNSTLGIAEIIVAKHRNGAVDDVRLRFQKEMAKFSDLDDMTIIPNTITPTYTSSAPVTFSSKMNNDPVDDFTFNPGKGIDNTNIPF